MLKRARSTLSWQVSQQLQQSAGLCSSQHDAVQKQEHKTPAGPLQGIKVPHVMWGHCSNHTCFEALLWQQSWQVVTDNS